MRIAIQTLGTRGDVQPYVALARELIERDHQVQVAAPEQYADLVLEHGIRFAPLPGEFLALMDTPEGQAAMGGGRNLGAGVKLLKQVRPMMRRLLDREWAAVSAFAPDLLLHHPKSLGSPHMAEALGCPHILASPFPGFTPTSAFPSPMLPIASLGPLNLLSHALAINGGRMLFSKVLQEWRAATLKLGRAEGASGHQLGTLYAYSRHVVPIPPDWNPVDVAVTGFWFLDADDWQPPPELTAFLNAGEPPIYIGFGSMPEQSRTGLAETLAAALERAGKRGVLSSGAGALGRARLPPSIHVISDAPHDKLLPLMSSAIHHGGAGTTGAVLRAGLPSLVIPFFGDQPFWGRRIAKLGVGPPPIDRRNLSPDRLAAALDALEEPATRGRAAALGRQIRQERGPAAAAAFIEAVMARCPERPPRGTARPR